MNKEQKVTSLELAKKIYDKAKEKGFELPESEYSWIIDNETGKATLSKSWNPFDLNECEEYSYCQAFDIAELGEMLPCCIWKNKTSYFLETAKVSNHWVVDYVLNCNEKIEAMLENEIFEDITEAEARGKMYFYLLDNNLL